MAQVEETKLPGVGVRYDFLTAAGERVGVLAHRTGYRELLIYDTDDTDSCRVTVRLDADDTQTLAELLGASRVSQRLTAMQHQIEGLAIDWLTIPPKSPLAGRSIAASKIRTSTGVSIVAVLREGRAIAAPEPTFELESGDIIVSVGTPEGVERLSTLLTAG